MSQPGKGGSGDQKGNPPARTATGSIPAQGGAAGKKGPVDPKGVVSKEGLSDYSTDSSILTKHQKASLGSGFLDSSAERKRSTLLAVTMPAVGGPTRTSSMDLPAVAAPTFDGKEAPAVLQGRDVWKAVQAPVQSLPGKRSKALYENVIKQFALETNPRYADDAPGKIRGHIFVWDVSRAMNCEIPHFVGAKELTLAQTCDWLRHEGPMRGWRRAIDTDIYDKANEGFLVVALPRDNRTKHLAIVPPQEAPSDNSPRLLGICLKRGGGIHPRDMFGSKPVDCFVHD